jgi:hypothetical protein
MLTYRRSGVPTLEFHVARDARDRYRFDEALYAITGNVIIANFHAARQFAHRMNQRRDLVNFPEQAVKASQVSADPRTDALYVPLVSRAGQSESTARRADLAQRQRRRGLDRGGLAHVRG